MNEGKPWTPSSIVLIMAGVATVPPATTRRRALLCLANSPVGYLETSAGALAHTGLPLHGRLCVGDRRAGDNGIPSITSNGRSNRRFDRRDRFHRMDGGRQFLDRLGLQMGSARDGTALGLQPCPPLVLGRRPCPPLTMRHLCIASNTETLYVRIKRS